MNPSTIKILMLVPNMRASNGVASYAMNYFRLLETDEIHMDFAIYSEVPSPYYEEIEATGCKCFILPSIKKPISHIKAGISILTNSRYDIIHDNTLLVSVPMMWLAKIIHVPVRLLHSHSARLGETLFNEKRNKLFLPLLKASATDYAACSSVAAKSMFGNASFLLIPNIVAENSLVFSEKRRADMRKEMGVEDKLVISTVGRTTFAKNPLFALEVIKEAVLICPNIEYWWIGSGAQDYIFNRKIIELGLSKHVKFLGSKERGELVDLYQAMDVFFMPSRFEGLGMAALEAQAMGLPCILSEEVPAVVDYTGNVDRIPLNAPAKEWAEALICQGSKVKKRQSQLEALKNSAYSEAGAGDRLLSQYKQLLQKNGRQTY